MKYKSLSCNKEYSDRLNEELKIKFKKTLQVFLTSFSNNDINIFLFLLRKAVYPYEYMNDQEKFNETELSKKEEFYINLNLEDIADYVHVKKVFVKTLN